MKNTLGDLNNHLFAQLEKLGDDDLTGEELESELKRTDAICDISEQIIKNGELQYKAMKHMDEYGYERQKAVPVRKTESSSGNARSSCGGGANHK
jgi:hypothetical protein